MMQFDVLGFQYDDVQPAFTPLNGGQFYYHIATGHEYEKASFDAWMTANSKTFGAKELGCPTAGWQAANDTIISRTNTVCTGGGTGGGTGGSGTAGTGSGKITAVAALTAAGAPGSPSTSGTITIGGGPKSDAAYTLTVTYAVDGGTDKSFTIPIAVGETDAAIVTALDGKAVAELGSTASGKVVTFDVAGGSATTSLDKLTAAVA